MTKTTGSALSTDVGGRIYLDEAPEYAAFPYIVFSVISDIPANTFTESLEDILIQFSLFSSSSGATEITTMFSDLKKLFDECTLVITANTHIHMVRENLMTMVDDVVTPAGTVTVRHWAVDYTVMLQKP